MDRVRVFLISGHMSVIDPHKIELNDSESVLVTMPSNRNAGKKTRKKRKNKRK